jgi:hypothetical protein
VLLLVILNEVQHSVVICIANNANITMDACSNLGHIFNQPPQYLVYTDEARTFLAGSNPFQLDEIEVYEKKA